MDDELKGIAAKIIGLLEFEISNQNKIIEQMEQLNKRIDSIEENVSEVKSSFEMLENIYDSMSERISKHHNEQLSVLNSNNSILQFIRTVVIKTSKNIEKLISLFKGQAKKVLPVIEAKFIDDIKKEVEE